MAELGKALGTEFMNWRNLGSGGGGGGITELLGLLLAGSGNPSPDTGGALGQGVSLPNSQFGAVGLQPPSNPALGLQAPANALAPKVNLGAPAIPPGAAKPFQLNANPALPQFSQDLNGDGIDDFWGVKR